MGREAKLAVDDGATCAEARVHLDSEYITIGPPFRAKLALSGLKQVAASADGLSLTSGKTRLRLAMSEKEAAAWAKSMLNPPSLATKLGLKPGLAIATLGTMPPEIADILRDRAPQDATLGKTVTAALAFAVVPAGVAVKDLPKLAKTLPAGGAIWLIYVKGLAFNGNDLIREARGAGLKDTKVAKISETHTALRFIPKS